MPPQRSVGLNFKCKVRLLYILNKKPCIYSHCLTIAIRKAEGVDSTLNPGPGEQTLDFKHTCNTVLSFGHVSGFWKHYRRLIWETGLVFMRQSGMSVCAHSFLLVYFSFRNPSCLFWYTGVFVFSAMCLSARMDLFIPFVRVPYCAAVFLAL